MEWVVAGLVALVMVVTVVVKALRFHRKPASGTEADTEEGAPPTEGNPDSALLDDGFLRLDRDPYESTASDEEFAGVIACFEATRREYAFGVEHPCIEGVPTEHLRTKWEISFDVLDLELFLREGTVYLKIWRFPFVNEVHEVKSVTFYDAAGRPMGTLTSDRACIEVLVGSTLTAHPRDPTAQNRGPMRFIVRFELTSGIVSHAFVVIDNNDYTAN